jgi:hypothetical protein
MGYYIERSDFGRFNKTEFLVEVHGAIELVGVQYPPWRDDVALVCVIHNSMFEAACYAYCPEELAALNHIEDGRKKRWVIMDKPLAEQLSGYNR